VKSKREFYQHELTVTGKPLIQLGRRVTGWCALDLMVDDSENHAFFSHAIPRQWVNLIESDRRDETARSKPWKALFRN
jgi:hypothetical protein